MCAVRFAIVPGRGAGIVTANWGQAETRSAAVNCKGLVHVAHDRSRVEARLGHGSGRRGQNKRRCENELPHGSVHHRRCFVKVVRSALVQVLRAAISLREHRPRREAARAVTPSAGQESMRADGGVQDQRRRDGGHQNR